MDRDSLRLHRQYAATGRRRDLERLVARYEGLARALARRYRRLAVANEDLEQVAFVGLVKAIKGFDPDRQCAFSTYAVPVILGEIRHYCRQTLWPVHVPRAVQERALRIRRVSGEVTARTGRAPTVDQLARRLQCDAEDVLDAVHAGEALTVRSVDAGLSADDTGERADHAWLATDDPGFAAVEDRIAADAALRSLTDEERDLLRLRFGEELSHRQIGLRLGMSASHVGRLLSSTLERLSAEATASAPWPAAAEPACPALGHAA